MGRLIESFEDGDLSEYSEDTGEYAVDGMYTVDGSFGLHADYSGYNRIYSSSINGPQAGERFRCPFNINPDGRSGVDNLQIDFGLQDADNHYRLGVRSGISLSEIQSGSETPLGDMDVGALSEGSWYEIEVEWQSDGTMTVALYDTIGSTNEINSFTASSTTYSSGRIGFQVGNFQDTTSAAWDYFRTVDIPTAPSNLSATQGSEDEIDLSWTDNSNNEEGFDVYRSQSSGGLASKTRVAQLAADTTIYTDTGLEDGEEFFYQIVATGADADSDPTNEDSAAAVLPSASGLSLDTSVEDEITLDWTRNDDSSDGTWELYRSTDGSLGTNIASLSNLSTSSYQDTGLADGERYWYTVRRSTDHATSDSQVDGVTVLPSPTNPSLTVASKSQIDASWTDNADNEDDYEIQTRPTGGSGWTGHGPLGANTTTGSATGLRNGELYDVRIAVSTEHVTEYSSIAQATTDFASITGLLGDASVEDQITLQWDDTANYGAYRVQHREGGASSWTDDGTVDESTPSKTITGLVDGRQYDFRARHETEHGQGSWTTISETTLLPTPSDLVASNPLPFDFGSDIPLSWTDNSDNPDETWQVLVTEAGGQQFDSDSGPLPANTESYTFQSGDPETAYDIKVRVETDYVYADSETVTASTPIEPGDAHWLALQTSTHDYVSITEIGGVEAPLEHTVKNGWSVTVPYSPSVEDRMGDEAWLFWGEDLLVRGIFLNPTSRQSAGETTLSGEDTAKRLDRGGAIQEYQSIEAWKAVEDYWGKTDFEATVHPPDPQIIDTGKAVQSASGAAELKELFGEIPDDVPLEYND